MIKTAGSQPTKTPLHSLCPGGPPAWPGSTCAGLRPCRRRSAVGSGCCRGRAPPACAPAAGPPTGGAARRGGTTDSRPPERWPAPEALQRRDYGKGGHINAQLDLLGKKMEDKVTKVDKGEWMGGAQVRQTNKTDVMLVESSLHEITHTHTCTHIYSSYETMVRQKMVWWSQGHLPVGKRQQHEQSRSCFSLPD